MSRIRLEFFAITLGILLSYKTALAAQAIDDDVVFITTTVVATSSARVAGSGVLLGPSGYILTDEHVLNNFDATSEKIYVHVKSKNSSPLPVQIIVCEPNPTDVCLLKVSDDDLALFKIETFPILLCREPSSNEPITAIGFPEGANNQRLDLPGVITGKQGQDAKYPMNVALVHGMSGGPVIDQRGSIIGLIKGADENNPAFSFFTPLFAIRGIVMRSPAKCEDEVAPEPIKSTPEPTKDPVVFERSFRVDITKDDHPSLTNSHSHRYFFPWDADAGSIITECIWRSDSSASISDQNCNIGPNGSNATFSFTLTSGPQFNQTRGWAHGTIILRERKT